MCQGESMCFLSLNFESSNTQTGSGIHDGVFQKSTRMLKTYRHINSLKSAQSIRFGNEANQAKNLQMSNYKTATK